MCLLAIRIPFSVNLPDEFIVHCSIGLPVFFSLILKINNVFRFLLQNLLPSLLFRERLAIQWLYDYLKRHATVDRRQTRARTHKLWLWLLRVLRFWVSHLNSVEADTWLWEFCKNLVKQCAWKHLMGLKMLSGCNMSLFHDIRGMAHQRKGKLFCFLLKLCFLAS